MTIYLSAAERALIASKIDFTKTVGRYSEAYKELVRISDYREFSQDRLSADQRYWFVKAAEINGNDQYFAANTAIRIITAAGLRFDGVTANQQNTSNEIAANVMADVLGVRVLPSNPSPPFTDGAIPALNQMITADINAALQSGGQTLGGWGGSFYYWNYAAPGYSDGRTIGQVISSSPAELEKFLTINAAAVVGVARAEASGPWLSIEVMSVTLDGFNAALPTHLKQEIINRAITGARTGTFTANPSLIKTADGSSWALVGGPSGPQWVKVGGGVGEGVVVASPEVSSQLDATRAARLELQEKGRFGDPRSLINQDAPRCFPNFTLISLPDGSAKRIDSIDIGDHVLTFDPHADGGRGALVSGVVTKLFSNVTTEWLKLDFASDATGTSRRVGNDNVKVLHHVG
jgi:hypothetical protein